MSGSPNEKQASATVFLVEELGDARLLCEKLKKYVDRAVQLIEKSGKKDHFFEVAGDIIEGLPKTTQDLHKALQAVALSTNRLDYEEIKQTLPAEKVDELEEVLDEIRLHPVRRQNMKPEDAVKQLHALAAQTKTAGEVPVDAALDLIAALEDGSKTASAEATADNFTRLAEALTNPPEGVQGVSRKRLAALVRQSLALSLDRPALTASRVAARLTDKSAKAFDIRDLKTLQKSLEDIIVEAKREKNKDIEGLATKALKNIKIAGDKTALEALKSKTASAKAKGLTDDVRKLIRDYAKKNDMGESEAYKALLDDLSRSSFRTASDEDKESRYEEGESADPTENMSEEDAKKWKENVDHDGSNIKSAASYADQYKLMKSNPPKVQKNTVMVYSPVVKKYIPQAEWGSDTEAKDDLKSWEKSHRETVQKLSLLAQEDSKKTAGYEEYTELSKVADNKIIRSMDKVVRTIEGNLKDLKASAEKYKSNPEKYAPQLDNFADDVRTIASAIRVFGRSSGKTASEEEEKEGRYEEGKPADPTENMSEEDAKKWKENVDYDGSNIKSAKVSPSDEMQIARMKTALDNLEKDLQKMRKAYEKYKANPGRNKSQIYTFENALFKIGYAKDVYERKGQLRAASTLSDLDKAFQKAFDKGKSSGGVAKAKSAIDQAKKKVVTDLQKLTSNLLGPGVPGTPISSIASLLKSVDDCVEAVGFYQGALNSEKSKSAAEEEKESKFEEGESADPTKNMSPEDAKKWKENVDHDGSNIKSAASLSKNEMDLLRTVSKYEALSVPPFQQDLRAKLIKKGLLANRPGLTAGAEITRKGEAALKSGKYAAVDWKVGSEKTELQDLLKKHGYDPKDVTKLMKDGIGPEELKSRLKNKPGSMGSLEYSHGIKKKAASDYSRIKPGSEVTIADSRGKKQTGKATKKGPAGWVLDMGGRRTTLATPDNTVKVK